LTSTEFQHALQLGLGRAVLYARSHDTTPLRDIILEACLHCYAYDLQIEGTRAPYIYDLIAELRDRDFYCNAVLASLASANDDADGVQRFRLATFFAEDGFPGAKEALYEHFQPWHTWGAHVVYGFVDLDGIEGLLFVAKKCGSAGEYWWLNRAYEKLGKEVCLDALRVAAASDADVAAFLAEVQKHEAAWANPSASRDETTTLRYPELAASILTLKKGHLMGWGMRASGEDIELAALGLVAETDPARQLAHLHLFARRPFPLGAAPILQFVHDSQTARAAILVLRHIKDPAVRDLAFQLVRARSPHRGDATDLLVENLEDGDLLKALRWFEDEDDQDFVHSLGSGLLKLYNRHHSEIAFAPILLRLYERVPCSHCRWAAVRRLTEKGVLPDALRAECAFDSNDDIRELVGKGEASL
jgi:hypothetical protein